MATDAMDLLLDAITDTLGVVMFTLLMVVLFGRAERAVEILDSRVADQVQTLRAEFDALAAEVAALPPPGDPELARRWRAALERIDATQPQVDSLRQEVLRHTARRAAVRADIAEAERTVEQARTEVATLERHVRAKTSHFVRVSRFQQDARTPVHLAVSGGRVARLRVTRGVTELAPPQSGDIVTDLTGVRIALQSLLHDVAPATHRVELVVWADSFEQAKVVEQALLDMGYDTNPLPVETGATLKPGTGGVQ